jgi:hypothetical protein
MIRKTCRSRGCSVELKYDEELLIGLAFAYSSMKVRR